MPTKSLSATYSFSWDSALYHFSAVGKVTHYLPTTTAVFNLTNQPHTQTSAQSDSRGLRAGRLSIMVLYVIGLGLGDEKDITVRGLEAVRRSAKVVLEHYTSILGVDKEKLVSGCVASLDISVTVTWYSINSCLPPVLPATLDLFIAVASHSSKCLLWEATAMEM